MKRKKVLASLVACSLLVVSLVGCNNPNEASNNSKGNTKVEEKAQNEGNINELSDYLGETYQQLIEAKGHGSDHVEDVEGKEVIVSSTYEVRMFNYNASLIFDLDDSKNISAVSVHFKGIVPDDILNNVKDILGNPTEVVDNKEEDSKVYQWKTDKYQFKLEEVGEETVISINKSAI
ncbi:hypothetical protein [Clostridium sp. B9]|uniref:hypothetical protein n=1 Tax=Clostridium sp. B9 TaxID=3423224 RepID=UPI003D2EC1BF